MEKAEKPDTGAVKSNKKTEDKLQECLKLKDEYLASWQRARSDLLNYQTKEQERIALVIKEAINDLALEVLPVLDNFDQLEKSWPQEAKEKSLLQGVLQIKKQIQGFLAKQGIEKIASLGQKFDPHFHELVQEIEDEKGEPGQIIEEIRSGYKSGERILRPARVKIIK